MFLDLLVAGEAGVGGFHDLGEGFGGLWVPGDFLDRFKRYPLGLGPLFEPLVVG